MNVSFRPRARWRGRHTHKILALVTWALLGHAGTALACDLCAIYTATEVQQTQPGFRIGVAEQFTRFSTLQQDGTVIDANGESMNSSITQVLFGYNINERFGLQLNLPIISRTFKRLTDDGLESGDETGIGDMSLLASYSPQPFVWGDGLVRVALFGGIKLPTGSSDRLGEEVAEEDDGHDQDSPFVDRDGDGVPDFPDEPGRGLPGFGPQRVVAHHTTGDTVSGIHGHDLALGSGSVDGIVGTNLFGSWKRLYATGSLQYFIRSQGSFNYQYANELLWRIGPGAFLALDDVGLGRGYTLGLQAIFSGETKGLDKLSGVKLGDTGYTGLYLGPGATFTWGENLQVTLGADIPVKRNNSEIQMVPDYRIRGGLTWRF